MTDYLRNFIAGGSFFFTVNLAERRLRLLTDPIAALRAAFRYVRQRHPFEIDAIVVLPDHLHATWTLPQGDADFAMRWQLIKSAFSRSLPAGERIPAAPPKVSAALAAPLLNIPFAMSDFARHRLHHINPVRHGHVSRVVIGLFVVPSHGAAWVYPQDWAGDVSGEEGGLVSEVGSGESDGFRKGSTHPTFLTVSRRIRPPWS